MSSTSIALRLGDAADVLGDRRVDVDDVGGVGTDRELLHVDARPRVEHRAALGDGDAPRSRSACPWPSAWCRRSGRRRCRTPGPAVADLLAVEQHGASSFSPSPMTTTPSIETVPMRAHRVDGGAVAAVLVAPADPAAGGHRRGLGDPDELHGQVAVGCLTAADGSVGHRGPFVVRRRPGPGTRPPILACRARAETATMQSVSTASEPGPPAKPPRSALTVRDLLGAVGLLVLVVLVIGGLTRGCSSAPAGPPVDPGAGPTVDAPGQLRAPRRQHLVHAAGAPRSRAGWRGRNSARHRGGRAAEPPGRAPPATCSRRAATCGVVQSRRRRGGSAQRRSHGAPLGGVGAGGRGGHIAG